VTSRARRKLSMDGLQATDIRAALQRPSAPPFPALPPGAGIAGGQVTQRSARPRRPWPGAQRSLSAFRDRDRLAANLAQAQPTAWGRVTAAAPCGAFLVAVSMIERRVARPALGPSARGPASPPRDVPDEAMLAAAAAPRPTTRPSTAGRLAVTRCAPAPASPARPRPACSASSGPAPGPLAGNRTRRAGATARRRAAPRPQATGRGDSARRVPGCPLRRRNRTASRQGR
jgi:hypothetical protein